MTLTAFRDVPVHCESWGDGPAVVFGHAFGGAGAQWRAIAERLPAYHCYAPDLLGFGGTGSWAGPEPLSHDLQADLLAAVAEDAGAGDAVHVVAHSYGGSAALRLAIRRPNLVRSLLLIEPLVPVLAREVGDPSWEGYRSMMDDFLTLGGAGRDAEAWERFHDFRAEPGTWAVMPERVQARFFAQMPQALVGFPANVANPTTLAECAGLTMPTTIVCGEATTAAIDRRVTELLRDAIVGSQYVVIPGAGHMSPLTHVEAVAAIVTTHLDRALGN